MFGRVLSWRRIGSSLLNKATDIAVLVHLIDLLIILLRCNGFARIQKTVVDHTGSRPPNSDHDLFFFFFGASLGLPWWLRW